MTRHDFEQLLDTFNATPAAEHVALIERNPISSLGQLAELLEGIETPDEAEAITRTNAALAAEWADACAGYAEMCAWPRRVDAILAAPDAERAALIAALTPGERRAFVASVLDERGLGHDEIACADSYFAMLATP